MLFLQRLLDRLESRATNKPIGQRVQVRTFRRPKNVTIAGKVVGLSKRENGLKMNSFLPLGSMFLNTGFTEIEQRNTILLSSAIN